MLDNFFKYCSKCFKDFIDETEDHIISDAKLLIFL